MKVLFVSTEWELSQNPPNKIKYMDSWDIIIHKLHIITYKCNQNIRNVKLLLPYGETL